MELISMITAFCCGKLRFEYRVTPRFLKEDTNGTSASSTWITDGQGLWRDILFESTIFYIYIFFFFSV